MNIPCKDCAHCIDIDENTWNCDIDSRSMHGWSKKVDCYIRASGSCTHAKNKIPNTIKVLKEKLDAM